MKKLRISMNIVGKLFFSLLSGLLFMHNAIGMDSTHEHEPFIPPLLKEMWKEKLNDLGNRFKKDLVGLNDSRVIKGVASFATGIADLVNVIPEIAKTISYGGPGKDENGPNEPDYAPICRYEIERENNDSIQNPDNGLEFWNNVKAAVGPENSKKLEELTEKIEQKSDEKVEQLAKKFTKVFTFNDESGKKYISDPCDWIENKCIATKDAVQSQWDNLKNTTAQKLDELGDQAVILDDKCISFVHNRTSSMCNTVKDKLDDLKNATPQVVGALEETIDQFHGGSVDDLNLDQVQEEIHQTNQDNGGALARRASIQANTDQVKNVLKVGGSSVGVLATVAGLGYTVGPVPLIQGAVPIIKGVVSTGAACLAGGPLYGMGMGISEAYAVGGPVLGGIVLTGLASMGGPIAGAVVGTGAALWAGVPITYIGTALGLGYQALKYEPAKKYITQVLGKEGSEQVYRAVDVPSTIVKIKDQITETATKKIDEVKEEVSKKLEEASKKLGEVREEASKKLDETKKDVSDKLDELQKNMREYKDTTADMLTGKPYPVNDYDYDGNPIPGEPLMDESTDRYQHGTRDDNGYINRDEDGNIIVKDGDPILFKVKEDRNGVPIKDGAGKVIPQKRMEQGLIKTLLEPYEDRTFTVRKDQYDEQGRLRRWFFGLIPDYKIEEVKGSALNDGKGPYLQDVVNYHADELTGQSLTYMLKGSGIFLATSIIFFIGKYGLDVTSKYLERLMKTPQLISDKVMYSRLRALKEKFFGKPTPVPLVVAYDVAEKMDILIKTAATARKQILSGNTLSRYPIILLHGEPGTGKTLFAEKLGHELDFNYIKISGSAIGQFTDGQGVAQIKNIFHWANKQKNGCLVFIDEAEGFLLDRKLMKNIEGDNMKSLLEFLAQVQKASNKIMLVFATNYPDRLDPAILDRVTDSLYVPLPGYKERLALIHLYYSKYINDVRHNGERFVTLARETFNPHTIARLARTTEGVSARSLENIIIKVKVLADISDEGYITSAMIDKARDLMMSGKNDIESKYDHHKKETAAASAAAA